jgi:hypothetical protein
MFVMQYIYYFGVLLYYAVTTYAMGSVTLGHDPKFSRKSKSRELSK